MSFTVEQVKSTVQMLIENGYHPVPVFISKKTGKPVPAPYLNPETDVYGIDHECWNQELPAIAVVLGRSRTLLLDWDYRKKRELESAIYRATVEGDDELPRLKHQQQTAQWTDLSALAAVLGGDALQEPYQTNPPHHDSYHYMFRLPEGVEPGDLKCAATDWMPNVDIKQNIALAYIKPGKVLTDEEIPAVSTLQVAPQPLIDALTKSSEAASRDFTRFDGAPEDFEEGVEILNHISADKYEQGQIPRDVWIMCLAGWCSKFGLGPDSQDVLIAWSRRDEAGFSHDLGDSWVIDQAESVSGPGGVTWNSVCDEAKKFGYDLNASAKRKAARRRERESREAVESSPNVTPLRDDVVVGSATDLWIQRGSHTGSTPIIDLPRIYAPSGPVGTLEYVANTLTNLSVRDDFFNRDGRMVQVLVNEEEQAHVEYVRPNQLRSEIERGGTRIWKWRQLRNEPGEYEDYETNMSADNAGVVLDDRKSIIEHMKPLRVLRKYPVLIVEGGKCALSGSGYNPEAGGIYVYSDALQFTPMPIAKAVATLRGLYKDFAFLTAGDESRMMAALITPALVTAGVVKGNVPIVITEATESQSGKSMLHQTLAGCYGEQWSPTHKRTGGVGSLDEDLSMAWESGESFVVIDNVKGNVNSSLLESAITSPDVVMTRVPKREPKKVSIRGTYLGISSNGLILTPDLANRSCIVRIRKRSAEHSFEIKPEGNLYDHARENASTYLSAIYSVIAHWVKDGMVESDFAGHDFREWARIVGGIIPTYFGLPHPMDDHKVLADDHAKPEKQFARLMAVAVDRAEMLGEELTASEVYDLMAHLEEEVKWPMGNRDRAVMHVGSQMGAFFPKQSAADESFRTEEVEGFSITRLWRKTPNEHGGDKKQASYRVIPINDEENAQEVMNHA